MLIPFDWNLIPSKDASFDPTVLPDGPGVYLVFFDSGQLVLEESGYLDFDTRLPDSIDGFDLLYVGATRDSLRLRALAHVRGDSRMSSLRMTVGAVLASRLGLEPVGDGTRTYFNFGDGERRLTDWMRDHTQIAVIESDNPFAMERAILSVLPAPFNISERRRHPFSRYLMSLRAVYAGRPNTTRPRPTPCQRSSYESARSSTTA